MPSRFIAGIILLVIGAGLFIVGLSASESIADQTKNFFTGTFTDRTMWYMIGGGVLAVGGLALVVFGGRRVRG